MDEQKTTGVKQPSATSDGNSAQGKKSALTSIKSEAKPDSEKQNKSFIRRWWLWIAAAIAGVVLIGGFIYFIRRPPPVEVGVVRQETVERTLAVTARVRPQQSNQIVPTTSGQLVELRKNEGESVSQGEILARIDSGAEKASVAQARAQVAAKREEVLQAQRELRRAESLHKDGIISTQELEQTRLKYTTAQATLNQLQQAVVESNERLEDNILRSPLSGVVLRRPVDNGQTVSPSTVIYEIATDAAPEIEAEVDEQYLPELKTGMTASVSALGNNRQLFTAKICYIAKEINRETGAATVRFCFDEPPADLPAGLSLDVNVLVQRHENALTVPRVAVAGSGRESFVFVVRNGRAVRQNVSVIDWQSPRVVVVEGLKPEDEVILTPKEVEEGASVRTRQPENAV